MSTEDERIEDWEKAPSYYQFPNYVQVSDVSGHLTSNGGQALQYIARSTRLDGKDKGERIEDLRKAERFIQKEIARLEEEAERRRRETTVNLTFTTRPVDGEALRRLYFGFDDGTWGAMDGYISTDGLDVEPEKREFKPGDRVRACDEPYWLDVAGTRETWFMDDVAGKEGVIEEREDDEQWSVDWGDDLSLFVHEDCLTLVEEEDADGTR